MREASRNDILARGVDSQLIVLFWLWRMFEWLVQATPCKLSLAIMEFVGEGFYRIAPQRKRIARQNFSHVLNKPVNDPAVDRVAAQAFRIFAREVWSDMATAGLPMSQIETWVTLHDEQNISDALALGKGLIVTMMHFGNIDLPTAVVATRIAPVTTIGENVQPPALMNYLVEMRVARNMYLYLYDQAPRKMLEALKRNEIVGLMVDFGVTHQAEVQTVEVDFFGARTTFPIAPAQLALLTGAPIIVAHCIIASNGHVDGHVGKPLMFQRTGNRQQDFQAIMQTLAHHFENFIRLYPEQWHMFRPMWIGNSASKSRL